MIMAVPTTFTQDEIVKAQQFIIENIKRNCIIPIRRGKVYCFVHDLAKAIGYEIKSEADGESIEQLAYLASKEEYRDTGYMLTAAVVDMAGLITKRFFDQAIELGLLQEPIDRHGEKETGLVQEKQKALVEQYAQRLSDLISDGG